MTSTQVIIADDHPLFRSALKQAVQAVLPDAELVEAESMASLEKSATDNPDADLVLLDLRMPGARGFSSLIWLRQQHPAIPVIVISAADDGSVIRRAADFGASGFIPKSTSISEIGNAVTAVINGELSFPDSEVYDSSSIELAERLSSLTPQQLRVLMLLPDGLLNKQIAYELGISEATVKAHMTSIMRKLGLTSRTQAALIAQQLDIGDGPVDSSGI